MFRIESRYEFTIGHDSRAGIVRHVERVGAARFAEHGLELYGVINVVDKGRTREKAQMLLLATCFTDSSEVGQLQEAAGALADTAWSYRVKPKNTAPSETAHFV
jgi:hypothetical protein